MTASALFLATLLAASVPAPPAQPSDKPSARAATKPTPPPPPPILEGTVKGPDGKPVQNAFVVAQPFGAEGSSAAPRAIQARTDAAGRFRLTLKGAGLHTLRVEAKGLAAQTVERARPGTPVIVTLRKGGSIDGIVRDGNTGQPIGGARVSARDARAISLPSEPRAGVVEALTDASGRFRLEGLAPSLQTLTARARGYGRAERRGITLGRSAELFLFPGAGLSGTVSGPAGTPVEGAVVWAEPEAAFRSLPPRAAETTTARGRFEILGLEPGSYRLMARSKDFAPALVTGIAVEAGADRTVDVVLEASRQVVGRLLDPRGRPVPGRVVLGELRGEPIPSALRDLFQAEARGDGRFLLESVPSGEHALAVAAPGFLPKRVDVILGEGERRADLGDISLETGLQIQGHVRDRTASPVADALLSVYPTMGGSRSRSGAECRSEADGSYALTVAEPGAQEISVTAPGFGEANRTVEAGARDVDFVLQPAGSITGVVVDEAGRPVESYQVAAEASDDPTSRLSPGFADVGSSDGRFTLQDLAAGTYVLSVAAPEKAKATLSNVKVTAGATTDAGRVRLTAGGTVRGSVVDSGGAPVAGATVGLSGSGYDWFPTSPQAVSDTGGRFEVKGAPAGTMDVVAKHPQFAEGRVSGVDVDPAKGPSEVRVVLSQGGRLEGWARRKDGRGIPAIKVYVRLMRPARVSGIGGPDMTVTRSDGSFSVEHIPPGRVQVAFLTPSSGYAGMGQTRDAEVREGETTSVEVVLREILVTGRVTRAGTPAPGLFVRLRGERMAMTYWGPPGTAVPPATFGPRRMEGVTREDGSYELLVDEPGKVFATVETLDGKISYPTRTVEIPDVDTHSLDFNFTGVPVLGMVVDKDSGRPVPQASVTAFKNAGQGSVGSGTAGPDGRFQLELDPGEYRIRAELWESDYGKAESDVTVTASGAPELRLVLPRGLSLSGKVVDTAGRPVGGVFVLASAGTGPGRSVGGGPTRPDGSFKIAGLAPQPHSLMARSNLGTVGLRAGVTPGTADVTVVLRPGARVRLEVLGPTGAPAEGVYAGVDSVDEVPVAGLGGKTDSQGLTEIVAPAGRVVIRARKEGLEGRTTLTLAEGAAATAQVRLAEAPKQEP